MTLAELHTKLKSKGINEDQYFLHGLFGSANDNDKIEYYPIIDKLLKETSEGEIVKLTLRLPGEIESNEEKDEDFSEGISFRVRKITTKDNFELSRESIKKVCQEYYLVLKNQVETCSGKFNY